MPEKKRIMTPDGAGGITRRELIGGVGRMAAGAALFGAGLTLFPSGEALAEYSADDICNTAGLRAKGSYPFPYKKIDPKLAADVAYRNWYKGFCAYATVSGILMPLQVSVGEPYTSLPLEAFAFGHGGTVGWGTLCGTLFGAGIAASFAAGKPGEDMINDLMAWYGDTTLPTYVPEKPKAAIKNTNASGSPLCHVSVGKWMAKEGVTFGSNERKDRCARLSANVAMRMVEMLNEWADGKYKPVHGSQVKAHGITAQNNCSECHGA